MRGAPARERWMPGRLGLLAAAYALGLAAMFLVFCEPAEYSAHWMRDLLLTKVFGVAAAWAAYTLAEISNMTTDNKDKKDDEIRN